MGPVPDEYDLLLDLIVKTEEVKKDLVDMGYANTGEKFTTEDAPDLSMFNEDERKST